MPIRFVLYDSLSSLAAGEKLVIFGDSKLSISYYLPGSPLVHMIADSIIEEGWIIQIENDCDGITHWVLSEKGLEVYKEGRLWYRSIPRWKKILGRFGFRI
jgi:hypothetical protein